MLAYNRCGDSMKHTIIRPATLQDVRKILEIYGWYIENTAITFEYTIPTEQAFSDRMKNIMSRYPYLVAECDGQLLGYAYAAPYITRKACDWSCEVSIYLARESTGQGLGRKLYEALENRLRAMGIVNMYASIACAEGEDPYVNNNSADFHAHMGFKPVGVFRNCGYKFKRWYHLAWVEKTIGVHELDMKEVMSYESIG